MNNAWLYKSSLSRRTLTITTTKIDEKLTLQTKKEVSYLDFDAKQPRPIRRVPEKFARIRLINRFGRLSCLPLVTPTPRLSQLDYLNSMIPLTKPQSASLVKQALWAVSQPAPHQASKVTICLTNMNNHVSRTSNKLLIGRELCSCFGGVFVFR